jgi:hypothetical protein
MIATPPSTFLVACTTRLLLIVASGLSLAHVRPSCDSDRLTHVPTHHHHSWPKWCSLPLIPLAGGAHLPHANRDASLSPRSL